MTAGKPTSRLRESADTIEPDSGQRFGLGWLAGGTAITLLLSSAAVLFYHLHWITAFENGAIENAQVVSLLLAGFVLIAAAIHTHPAPEWMLNAVLSVLCITFIFRELDVDQFDLGWLATALGGGIGRNLLLSGMWLVLGIIVALRFGAFVDSVRRSIHAGPGKSVAAACVIYGSAWLFDKNLMGYPTLTALLYEELLEFGACVLILTSSFALLFAQGRASLPRQVETPISEPEPTDHCFSPPSPVLRYSPQE